MKPDRAVATLIRVTSRSNCCRSASRLVESSSASPWPTTPKPIMERRTCFIRPHPTSPRAAARDALGALSGNMVTTLIVVVQFDRSKDRVGTMLARCKTHLGPLQVNGTIDQRDMGIGLRIITQRDIVACVDLLRKQAQTPGICQQTLEEGTGFSDAPLHGQVIHQPEGTDGEGAL